MISSVVYYGNTPVGEVEVCPKGDSGTVLSWAQEMVDRLSPSSERCPPLAVLHVAAGARCLVMESKPTATAHEPPPPLIVMQTTCLRENKVKL